MNKTGIVLAAAMAFMAEAQAADPPPVKLYAQPAAAVEARLSPNGKRVGLIATYKGRRVLYVHSLEEGGKDGKIVRPDEYEALWLRWKDNDHLVAGIFKPTSHLFWDQASNANSISRLIEFDAGGNQEKNIGEPASGFFNRGETAAYAPKIHPQHEADIISMLPQTPGHILQMVLDKFPQRGERLGLALYSIDIETGEHELVEKGDGMMWRYILDKNAVARAGIEHDHRSEHEHEFIVYAKVAAADPWREIHRYRNDDDEVFQPLAFVPDKPQMLYVLANRGPDNKAGLWTFDVSAGRFADLIDDQANIARGAQIEEGVLQGYERKDGSGVYLDPAWQADYLAVSKAMKGGDVSVIDRMPDGSRVLLEVHKEHHPKVWWILDRAGKSLNLWPAVEEYPDIPAERVAPVREVKYTARDGLVIPAYLTLPIGYKEGPIPFVVLPHGGPFVCEGTDFDYESQFLASRGWGVLRPQFRGTSCYGPEFERKGFREWGFAMQDDVTDGTHWLIDQHYADPARICIVGGSYGGYAALEGVEKEPDLYRCAAAWAPVTELFKLRDATGGTGNPETMERLGNDYARLKEASPAAHADRIKVPVLLMHGKDDFTVDMHQSELMEESLRGQHKAVDAIYLDHADHYRLDAEARTAWLSALDSFLGAQLGRP
jgi:dipeptidyl aminopeptidase/acylaminoacyl peptidase